MPWGAVVGGLLAAGGAAYAADEQGDAAQDAAAIQGRATEQAVQNEAGMYNASQTMLAPTRQLGALGQQRMAYLLGLTPNLDVRSAFATPTLDPKTGQISWSGAGALAASGGTGGIPSTQYQGPQGSRAVPGSTQQPQQPTGLSPQPDGTVRPSNQNHMFTGADGVVQGGPAVVDPSQNIPNANAIYDGSEYGSFARPFALSDLDADPGYQFRRDQGEDALARQAAASGLTGGGSAIKDALEFNSGLASQEYAAAFQRSRTQRLDQWNMLAGITGAGQVANESAIGAGQTSSGNITNALFGGANADAAARIAAGNAGAAGVRGMFDGIGTAVQGGFDLYDKKNPPPPANGTQVGS